MPQPQPLSDIPSNDSAGTENRSQRRAAAARAAIQQLQSSGDSTALDALTVEILGDYLRSKTTAPLAELPGTTQLVADLGFDSLAIAELVFYTEDLLGITISNEEIVGVRTIDELRGFIRAKIAGRATR